MTNYPNYPKPIKLTNEIKQAITNLVNEDVDSNFEQPINSPENIRCKELGLIDDNGNFYDDLPEDILTFYESSS